MYQGCGSLGRAGRVCGVLSGWEAAVRTGPCRDHAGLGIDGHSRANMSPESVGLPRRGSRVLPSAAWVRLQSTRPSPCEGGSVLPRPFLGMGQTAC